jgi:prevent-host-death family protein
MRTMSAKEAKSRFGELLLAAQREAVVIERNGRPVAVVLSHEEHEEIERMKLEWLRAAVAEGIADAEAGRVTEVGDVDAFVDEIMRDMDERTKAAE